MPTPTTVAELIDRVAASQRWFMGVVAPLTATQLQEPLLPGGWSVKDVLAHLAWWDRWLLYTIQPDGEGGRRPPPLVDEITAGGAPADRVNERVYQLNRQRDLAEIQAEFEDARRRVLQAVESLTDDDLFDPNGRSAIIGRPLAPLVFGIYEHYEEHALEIQALHG